MAGFHFSKIPVFKIRGGSIVDERGILPLRLLILSTVPILMSTVPAVVEVVDSVSSSLPTPGAASVQVAIVFSITGVVRDDSPSLPFEVPVRPSEDVDHQGKGKGVATDK
ncbi:hypothetical protein Fot_35173 [Forsythia ovata]|uniref:Uncharacterized protein n=1 Tax=Forsythia ovata TaxID=205694 RepID=A0ABD1SKR9_9LAMI